jgi:thioredoxin reductase
VAVAEAEVLIVGAGPAGLAAAVALREARIGPVVVAERDPEPGGVPRHTRHLGFGLRDLHRARDGPGYAAAYAARAARLGVDLRTCTTVLGWAAVKRGPAVRGPRDPAARGPRGLSVEVTGPDGLGTVRARALLLATGCRERPRAARLVPGDRPLGVLTTGMLQQLVHLQHQPVGRRAVVVGAEHVSYSAVLTLAHAGAATVALVTEEPRHQTFAALHAMTALRFRVPLFTGTRVAAIIGRPRVEAVELTDLKDGQARRLPCDTVVFSGDWIPDHELARTLGVALDPATRGPLVDQWLRSSVPGVFAAGNLLHGAETADLAALEGRHAAASIAEFLAGGAWPGDGASAATTPAPAVPVACEPPLRWVTPGLVVPGGGGPPSGWFTLRSGEFRDRVRLEVRQGGRALWRGRRRDLVPTRAIHARAPWIARVDPAGGPVLFSVAP